MLKPILEFKNENEEREIWAAHDFTDISIRIRQNGLYARKS